MDGVILGIGGLVAAGIVAVMAYWAYTSLHGAAAERQDLYHDRERVRQQRVMQARQTRRWLELKLGAALARRQGRSVLADGYEREADQMLGVSLSYIGERELLQTVRRIVADQARTDLEILVAMARVRRALDRQQQRLTEGDDSALISVEMDLIDEAVGPDVVDRGVRRARVRPLRPRSSPRRPA